jgi:hypothetical protein
MRGRSSVNTAIFHSTTSVNGILEGFFGETPTEREEAIELPYHITALIGLFWFVG